MNDTDRKFSTSLLIPNGLGASRVFGEMEVKSIKELTEKSNSSWGPNLEEFQLSTAQLNEMVIG